MKKLLIYLIIAGVVGIQNLIPIQTTRAASDSTPSDVTIVGGDWTEPVFDETEIKNKQPLLDFAQQLDATQNKISEFRSLFELINQGKIIINDDDLEAVKQKKIDDGLLKTLVYLVTPIDQGGAGFERIKVKRLVKNYRTERRGMSKETEYADNEEVNVSAHYKGEAVDLSEIDLISLKKKTKRKSFGVTVSSSTKDLAPVPINVAWQSEKGKGEGIPGFSGETANELFTNLSLGSLKDVLSDLVEYDVSKMKGEDFPSWAKWLGVAMLFEDFDLPQEGFEDDIDMVTLMKSMGQATLAQALGIDKDAIKGGSRDELIDNIAKSYLEDQLKLEQGSLTGDTLRQIFENSGRRKLEKELNMKKGSLDGNLKEKLKDVKKTKRWQTYKNNEAKEAAMDLPEGSVAQIEKGDNNAFALVGAAALFYTLSVKNQKEMIGKIRRKEPISGELQIDEASLTVTVDKDTLQKVISKDKEARNTALAALGEEVIKDLVFHPDLDLGLKKEDWEKIKSGQIKVDDIVTKIGSHKIEQGLDLPSNGLYYTIASGKPGDLLINLGRAAIEDDGDDVDKFTDAQKTDKGRQILRKRVASVLNSQYLNKSSYSQYQISEDDVVNLLSGKWEGTAQKIASATFDKALKLPVDGTMDIVTGKKSPKTVMEEAGAVRLGNILGLDRPVAMTGNLQQNYGQALIEERLGLPRNSFSGTLAQVREKIGINKYQEIFNNSDKTDQLLGLPTDTTRRLLGGELTVEGYSKKVTGQSLKSLTVQRMVDYFDLPDTYKPTEADINQMVSTVSNWDTASPESQNQAIQIVRKAFGVVIDSKLGFEPETFDKIMADKSQSTNLLLTQGMKKLNKQIFGLEKEVIILRYKEGRGLTARVDGKALTEWATPQIKKVTGITEDADAKTFLTGDIKNGLTYWGMASIAKEANEIFAKHGISGMNLSYEDARKLYFGDAEYEALKMAEAETQLKKANPNASASQVAEVRNQARVDARGEKRKAFQYRVYDSYLIDKVDDSIPVGFAKTMFEGTPEERMNMMGGLLLSKITGGQLTLTPAQITAVAQFTKDKDLQKLGESGVFESLDTYLNSSNLLGFRVQKGTSAALIKMASGKSQEGLSELKGIYINWAKDWVENRVFAFADKFLGFQAGTAYQLYNIYQNYHAAQEAYQAAKAIGDAAATADASRALNAAKQAGIAFAVHMIAGKTLGKVDQKLGLGAGTTENLLLYFAFSNPAFLVAAVIANAWTVKVEIYGEIPICEQTGNANTTVSSVLGIFKGGVAGYERLSGDSEKDFPFYQRHAQCSVKRMIGALLEIEGKTNDPVMQPTQIITLRQEDVAYYAQKVADIYGKTERIRGNRGLGWSDLMWQYVHVGY